MIANIQALRALAALLVIFVHCETTLDPLNLSSRFREAFACGVDLFFVISGFIMVYTSSRAPPTPVQFILRRIARIVPLYWFFTLAVFIAATASPSLFAGTKASVSALVGSLFFYPYVRDDLQIRPLLYLGWSLNYEMFFYLIFSAGLFIRAEVARTAFVSAVILACIALGSIIPHSVTPIYYFTRPVMIEFVLGMALALAYPHLPTNTKIFSAAAVLSGLGLVVISVVNTSSLPLTAIPATLLVLSCLALERGGVRMTHKPTLLLGAASYSLYLSHPFIAQAINKIASSTGLLTVETSIPWVIAIYIAAIAAALCVYAYLERPMTNYLLRMIDRAPESHLARPKRSVANEIAS